MFIRRKTGATLEPWARKYRKSSNFEEVPSGNQMLGNVRMLEK